MSRIIGDPEVIRLAKQAIPGDKTVYINWEAINDMGEQYEAVLSKVTWDTNNLEASFYDLGNGNYMPTPELNYAIADKRGIRGIDNSSQVPIYEIVNYSLMEMNDQPHMLNILVGYQSTKQACVMMEDGFLRPSQQYIIPFNAWNRCTEEWTKEEEKTLGYSESKQKKDVRGKNFYPITWYNKSKRKEETYSLYPKYDNKYKRRAHFESLKKFAAKITETQATERCIRELARLMTGYTKEDLKKGYWIFSKVRRSTKALQMETAARLQAISRGQEVPPLGLPPQDIPKLLFGENTEPVETDLYESTAEPEPLRAEEQPDFMSDDEPTTKPKSKGEQLRDALDYYNQSGLVADNVNDSFESLIAWACEKERSPKDDMWPRAMTFLKDKIEASIGDGFKYKHDLY